MSLIYFQGLHRFADAYESYGKAIALLDAIENPSSAEIARKVKIEQALAEAQRKEAGPDVLLIRNATGNLPWDKATGWSCDSVTISKMTSS